MLPEALRLESKSRKVPSTSEELALSGILLIDELTYAIIG